MGMNSTNAPAGLRSGASRLLVCGFVSLAPFSSASAQLAFDQTAVARNVPLEEIPIRVAVDSGPVLAPARADGAPELVFSTEVGATGSSWVRLQFDEVLLSGSSELGNDAFLWITSLADGAVQIMTQRDLERWQYTSAYFNGDTVRVELFAYPGAGKNRVSMDTIMTGSPNPLPMSLCAEDDRELSFDNRSARVLPAQCTAFMIDDQTHNFLTAGHCRNGLNVVQFNVPMSTAGGGLVNPGPEDQYPVDPSSIQFKFAGLGDDWAYFGVFPNSNTGLTPYQAEGVFHTLAVAAPPVTNQTIRITGYGVDTTPAMYNSVQQTSTGPYTERVGSIIRYFVDTTSGNSGSAVIDLTTGLCIGIHTNGGCTIAGGGANQGTAIQNNNLQNALANPLGVAAAADCNNNGVPDFVETEQGGDCNSDGVLDACQNFDLAGDLNDSGAVDGEDLAMLLGMWGANGGVADINHDGIVDGADLAMLLATWGGICN